MNRTRSILVVVFLAGAYLRSRPAGGVLAPAPGTAVVPVDVVAPSDVEPDPWSAFDPVASAAPTAPACDETAQMMVAMFGALANQALVNAGKDPGTLGGAVASDRAAFIGYLTALGLSPDDPQVEAMLGAAFPVASTLPVITPTC
jgi:hypothetical protein